MSFKKFLCFLIPLLLLLAYYDARRTELPVAARPMHEGEELYYSEGLAEVLAAGRYGYVDRKGDWVIPPQFIYAKSFHWDSNGDGAEPYAFVEDEVGWHLIDRAGTYVASIGSEEPYDYLLDGNRIIFFTDEGTVYCVRTEHGYRLIEQVGSSFDRAEYDPNAGAKVATPDAPAALRLPVSEDALPNVDGATALYPVYAALVQAAYPDSTRYTIASEGAPALITCSKTDGAYRRLTYGQSDIIFVAGPSDQQVAAAAGVGVEFELTPIGREAFVFIVNAENPLDGLSSEQLKSVYSGSTRHWGELGAPELGAIAAYQRPEDSGSQTAFLKFMKGTPPMPAPKDIVMKDMGEIIDVVEYRNTPDAIGYSFRFYVTGLLKSKVKLLAIDGVSPTVENITNGTYPLVTQLYAVTRKGDKNANLAAFLEWVQSEQGMELIEKSGYVPEY